MQLFTYGMSDYGISCLSNCQSLFENESHLLRFVLGILLFLSILIFLDIEEEGCESTYVQWVQTHSSNSDDINGRVAIIVSDSLLPSTLSKDFECEQGQPGKFR